MGRTTPREQPPRAGLGAPPSQEKAHRSPRNKMSNTTLEQQHDAGSGTSWSDVRGRCAAQAAISESCMLQSPRAPSPIAMAASPRAYAAQGEPTMGAMREDVHMRDELVRHVQVTVHGSLERLLKEHLEEMRSVLREELPPAVSGNDTSEGLSNEVKVKAVPHQSEQSVAPSECGLVRRHHSGKDRKLTLGSYNAPISGEESNPDLADVQVEPDPPVPTSLAEAIGHLFPALEKQALCISDKLSVFGKGVAPKRTDLISRFVDSATFKLFIYGCIFLNVGFMVYSANEEVARYETGPSKFVQTVELGFVAIYTVELILRLWRFRMHFWYEADWKWNWLDAFLLMISYYLILLDGALPNVSWLRMLRLLKLTKVLRVFRVITMFKTLRAILVSLVSTMSTLFWSMVMLYIIIFMFALTFTMLVGNWLVQQGENLDEVVAEPVLMYFSTVNDSCLALYMCVTGGNDWSIYYDALSVTGAVGPYMLLLYIFFTQVAVMNIILGMFVNQAIDNMKATREEAAKEHAEEMRVRDRDLCEIIRSADISGDGVISIDEWRTTLKTGNVASYLDICGFRPGDVHAYYKMLYKEAPDGRVNMEDFVRGCLHLRGRASKFDMHMLACNLKELKEQVDLLARG